MGIKVSDIMLDLGSGDACVNDVYVEQAIGQVNVSSAIFTACEAFAESFDSLDDSEKEDVVQEAANAGLPTTPEGAVDCAYEALSNALVGTFRHFYSESAIVQEAFTGPTCPLKGIVAIAKKLGANPEDLKGVECDPASAAKIAKAIGKVKLAKGKRFVKPGSIKKLTEKWINGTSLVLNAYCTDTSDLYDSSKNPAVAALIKSPLMVPCPDNAAWQLNTLHEALEKIDGSIIGKSEELSLKESDYFTGEGVNIGTNELATLILCYMAWGQAGMYFKGKLTDQGKAGRERAIKKMVAVAKDGGRGISYGAKKLASKITKKDAPEKPDSAMADVPAKSLAEESGILERMNKKFQSLGKTLKGAYNDSLDAVLVDKTNK